MTVYHESDVENIKFNNPQANEASMRTLISPEDGWDGYVMRVLELAEGGYSPKHSHPWPHINYILEGKGILTIDGQDHPVEKGSTAYVAEGKLHQFKNAGKEVFKFICIVPEIGHK